MRTKKIKIILEKSPSGYSAYAENTPAIYTAGKDIQEVKENIQEVIQYQIEYLEETGKLKESVNLKNSDVAYYIDVEQFFEEYNMINKSAFAKSIGQPTGYIRKLSKGLVKLSDKKSLQLQKGLHKLGKELQEINFV